MQLVSPNKRSILLSQIHVSWARLHRVRCETDKRPPWSNYIFIMHKCTLSTNLPGKPAAVCLSFPPKQQANFSTSAPGVGSDLQYLCWRNGAALSSPHLPANMFQPQQNLTVVESSTVVRAVNRISQCCKSSRISKSSNNAGRWTGTERR